jgi:hypothetical protein
MGFDSHEYPIHQVEQGVDSPQIQEAGDNFAKAYLNFLKARFPDIDTVLASLNGRQYKPHYVWQAWFHVQKGQIVFNYGEEKQIDM